MSIDTFASNMISRGAAGLTLDPSAMLDKVRP